MAVKIAYYCSGHGFGHATRVCAFVKQLLALPSSIRPQIHIVSPAPEHVFSSIVAMGAFYRHADICPVVVQPFAYWVDREKSLEALHLFIDRKGEIVEEERVWLVEKRINAVLSDAAFLGCLAASISGIPSALVTNFTFDSVFSYLAVSILQLSNSPDAVSLSDTPLVASRLDSLVEEMLEGYRCANLLLLLPGCIPIPSFAVTSSLPSTDWVDSRTNRFTTSVESYMNEFYKNPSLSSARGSSDDRLVVPVPRLVRSLSPLIYTEAGRLGFLTSIGVPWHLYDHATTKILVVSFGGQTFRAPSRPGSSPVSPHPSRSPSPDAPRPSAPQLDSIHQLRSHSSTGRPTHIWVPGAPPAAVSPQTSPVFQPPPVFKAVTIPPTPITNSHAFQSFSSDAPGVDSGSDLLPDKSWIAIICGATKQEWTAAGNDLPPDFYLAPENVYVPDLTAVADVLLGKLGYGTVSECIEASTPFVYVPRPLFVEEHGLRLWLTREGVGLELSQADYEDGRWSAAVSEAYERGRETKLARRAGTLEDSQSLSKSWTQIARAVVNWAQGDDSLLRSFVAIQ
ncbi:hypothetical protein FISHEDRAFT_36546 [Fistulina hepatica ATCC 64428]|uniref:Uncharacterized protein n=1 Tax=Fistulina hepatica ATCC 64428 TaxID=1128425 RepID=A0A0D7AIV5_9AGAR|nr:hypothetical protein FISHEDRAFT_36546 [Fistulina hepatica ATCC 64428]